MSFLLQDVHQRALMLVSNQPEKGMLVLVVPSFLKTGLGSLSLYNQDLCVGTTKTCQPGFSILWDQFSRVYRGLHCDDPLPALHVGDQVPVLSWLGSTLESSPTCSTSRWSSACTQKTWFSVLKVLHHQLLLPALHIKMIKCKMGTFSKELGLFKMKDLSLNEAWFGPRSLSRCSCWGSPSYPSSRWPCSQFGVIDFQCWFILKIYHLFK